MQAVAEKPMAKRNDVSVKIDAGVAKKARLVAEFEDKPFAEFLSDLLEPILDRELAKHSERVLKEQGKAKPKGQQ